MSEKKQIAPCPFCGAAKAKCARLEDTLSELNDALMSRMASTRPNAKQRIRLINASIRASTELLKLKGKK